MPAKADPHRFDDLFAAFGRITLRRMFGGEGIFTPAGIIGIVMRDQIYLRADDASRDAYIQEGCKPFAYQARGAKRQSASYYAIPERLYDDPEELAVFARRAQAAALSGPKRKNAGKALSG